MDYKSFVEVESRVAPGVRFVISRMSFARRVELMKQIREMAGKAEFLEAGPRADEKMEAALLCYEIDRLYLHWGLREVSGLAIDGGTATVQELIDRGPEELCREALAAVKAECGLSEAERKN